MSYLLLFVASCGVLLAVQYVSLQYAKIETLKENRKQRPVTIFPIIPFVPIFLVFVTWIINRYFDGTGYLIFILVHTVVLLWSLILAIYGKFWLLKNYDD